MKTSTATLIALLIVSISSSTVHAQQEATHAPDGGTWERIQSISIPPLPKAPFTGTVNTEWVRTLEDGSTVTVQNHRSVMRDSAGRVFEERRTLVPSGQEPQVWRTEISDPSTRKRSFWFPEEHRCMVTRYLTPASVVDAPIGMTDDGKRQLVREDLGKSTVSGVEVVGTRETTTISTGVMGNDRPMSITKEIWYSPLLGINLSVKRVDPRHGAQTFTVTDIGLAEPDPKYFEVPAGYTLDDPASLAAHGALRGAVQKGTSR